VIASTGPPLPEDGSAGGLRFTGGIATVKPLSTRGSLLSPALVDAPTGLTLLGRSFRPSVVDSLASPAELLETSVAFPVVLEAWCPEIRETRLRDTSLLCLAYRVRALATQQLMKFQ
jgi:hypothetical protein